MGSDSEAELVREIVRGMVNRQEPPFTRDELATSRGPGSRAATIALDRAIHMMGANLGRVFMHGHSLIDFMPAPAYLWPEKAELIAARVPPIQLRQLRLWVALILLAELGKHFGVNPSEGWPDGQVTCFLA
jgi:hypothetical protein